MSERDREAIAYETAQQLRPEYVVAFGRYQVALEQGDSPEEIQTFASVVRDLQTQHLAAMREWRSFQYWFARAGGPHIELVPDRCMGMVAIDRQCSRRATYRVGDIIVCTQHSKHLVDMWDIDGRGFSAVGVMEPFPRPFFWERI